MPRSSRPICALPDGWIPSNLRRWMQRRRGNATRDAPTQQETLISTEGDCKLDEGQIPARMATAAAGVSDHVTVVESVEVGIPSASDCDVSTSLSNGGVSERIGRLVQVRSQYVSDTQFEIEASKEHWSELNQGSDEDDDNFESDWEDLQRLKQKWGNFFYCSCCQYDFVLGEKIAEGGQAEIFATEWGPYITRQFSDTELSHWPTTSVFKVFKKGYKLRDLERQWPLGMLQNHRFQMHRSEGLRFNNDMSSFCCEVKGATLLKGTKRFAFELTRYWGDLRKLIDIRMQLNGNQCPPFTKKETKRILHHIAQGMQDLHGLNIIHRDLKASNILLRDVHADLFQTPFDPTNLRSVKYVLADYECSVGVVGTGYWRAPEILRAVQERNIKPELFTEKSDVYSFAMTCYEVLTGCIPFEELGRICYDIVLAGQRPDLPSSIDPAMRTLVSRCWHSNSLERPSFREICECLPVIFE